MPYFYSLGDIAEPCMDLHPIPIFELRSMPRLVLSELWDAIDVCLAEDCWGRSSPGQLEETQRRIERLLGTRRPRRPRRSFATTTFREEVPETVVTVKQTIRETVPTMTTREVIYINGVRQPSRSPSRSPRRERSPRRIESGRREDRRDDKKDNRKAIEDDRRRSRSRTPERRDDRRRSSRDHDRSHRERDDRRRSPSPRESKSHKSHRDDRSPSPRESKYRKDDRGRGKDKRR